jgi:adenine phosphoribosyltransferase
MSEERILSLIRDIPDFPKPGIVFKDITPLLKDAKALAEVLERMADFLRPLNVDMIVGPESRGFIFGVGVSQLLGVGFVPIRKPGKLPFRTRSQTYNLEYGTDTIEIHEDAMNTGQRAALVDDVLATGGTMSAACQLVEGLGATVAGCAFLMELGFLNGRELLANRQLFSVLSL